MPRLEALIVRTVARLVHVEHRNDEARLAFSAALAGCGLDIFRRCLGLPQHTAINPSREMSRPTEIMFVASAMSRQSALGRLLKYPVSVM